jgi:phosphopantothenoylcysteine decarboxylase/phosphopantothenate--cysteine ligase
MYRHQSTISNLSTLKSFGNFIIEAPYGELASGLIGEGRLEEPENIISWIKQFFIPKDQPLLNYKFVITAGPTYEALDPVRFIGNHSSGKMGLALADTIAEHGGIVDLVLGPNNLNIKNDLLRIHHVTSGHDMYKATAALHNNADVVIFAAAVADYRPATISDQKIKKADDSFTIDLVKNVDIAKELGKIKKSNQIHIGFALETENEECNAKLKVEKKNFDFIVLNSLNDLGAGFKLDTNKIKIINKAGIIKDFPTKSKHEVAKDIILEIINTLHSK